MGSKIANNTITLHDPGSASLGTVALNFELVGVFDVQYTLEFYGVEVAANYAKNGNARKYWRDANNGFGSVLLKQLEGFDGRHPPVAIFVATKELNPRSKQPCRTKISEYRAAFPCIQFDEKWRNLGDAISHFRSIKSQKPDVHLLK